MSMCRSMNYTSNSFYLKQNWFSDDDDPVFARLGYKAFNIYLNLNKFRVQNQSEEYTYITSIGLLRKETGYTSKEIYDGLRILVNQNVVKLLSIKRMESLADGNKIKDKDGIVLCATDVPDLKNDRYISISLEMIQYYMDIGLDGKYIPLYCLVKGWCDTHVEKKMYVGIEKISKILGYSKDTVHKMIHRLNREYLMYSAYRDSKLYIGNKAKNQFEHHICGSMKIREQWLKEYKDKIDQNIKYWDKNK